MKKSNGIMEVFKIFQNRESYFEEISNKQSNRLILNQIIIICAFAFMYGMVMGSYHSFLQSLVTGFKVVALFLCSIIICFPSLFIIQQVLGSTMNIRQMLLIVLSGLVLSTTIILSFSPVVIFFQITGGNYHFLQLLHVAIFVFGGIFGLMLMVDALKYAYEKKAIYPQIGVTVFKIWIVILAFVGIQLSWNLRPFLCERNEEFKLFRNYEGNFYTAIVYSVEQLVSKNENQALDTISKTPYNSYSQPLEIDTTSHLYMKKK